MIEIFKKAEGELKRVKEFEKYRLVNVSNPTKGDLEKLMQELNIPFTTLPVGIILTKDLIVTICLKANIVWENFITNSKVKDFSSTNRNRLILHFFQRTAVLYLGYLKEINKRTTAVEEMLQKAMKNEELI